MRYNASSTLDKGFLKFIFAGLFAVLIGSSAIIAQSTNGSLTGVISDEQGAAIAGANVSIVSIDRNRTEGNIQATEDGNYTFPSLIPGTYKLVVEQSGFSRTEISPVIIELNVRQRVDVKLKVGSVGATVDVQLDAAEQIERDTSAVGTVVNQEQVQNLPLFERNPTNLIALAPGVSAGSDAEGRLSTSQLSVNGSRTLNNEVTVDGVSAVNGSTGDVSFVPSVESLREFRVQTATYSAEFGRTSGATVSALVSSGTSKYRGSVYEYFRNEALNANNYFNNSRGIARPADRFNQFGGTIGGPLPMFNFGEGGPVFSRDKTFFFFNYEGLRRTVPRQFTSTVPTQAFRNGDFSSSLGAFICRTTTGTTVTNPTAGCPTGSTPVTVTNTNNQVIQAQVGQLFRQSTVVANRLAYAGNIIPNSEFDPAARAFLALLPLPNLPGSQRNYLVNSSDEVNTNQGTLRVDHNFTDNARMYARYSLRKGTDATFTVDAAEILPGVLNPGTGANRPVNHQLAIGFNQSLTPTIFNEFTFGFNRDVQTIDPPGAIDSPAALGFQRAPQLNVGTGSGFYAPAILFPGGDRFGFSTSATAASRIGINGNTLRRQNTNTFQVSDAISFIRGSHTIKAGVQFRRNGLDIFNGGGQFSANYTINGDNLASPITQIAAQNTLTTQFAAFLLGQVDSAVYQIPQPQTGRRNYNLGFFVQDDWKVTPKLTLNLGVRYDYESPLTINNDIYSRVDTQNGRLLVAGVNASRSLNLESDKNNFGPRVGFAYSLDENTVVRAAYGLFFSQVFSNLGGSGALFPGFTVTQQFNRRGAGLSQAFSLSQGIPLIASTGTINPFLAETNASPTSPLQPSAQFGAISPLPEVHQWSIGVQRVIPFGITFDAAYVGTRGLFLPIDSTDFNSVPPELFEQVAAGNATAGTQLARRFSNVGTLNAFENVGSSIYHSAQFKVTRRFSAGFGLNANYTFSKSIDDGSGIYNFSQPNGIDRGVIPTFRRDLDRSVSSFDRPHVFTMAIQYALPFGKGKMFFNDSSSSGGRILGTILGGWQINALTQARSGLPDTITLANLSGIGTLFQPRPNSNGQALQVGLQPGPGGTVRYIQATDSANFPLSPVGPVYVGTGATRTRILPFSIGSLGRNTIRAPNSYNTDLSLIRRFRISERMNFNVRAEAFNVFNQTTFLFDPAGSTTSLPVVVSGSNQAVFNAPNFGLIDRSLPARRIQLVARFEF
ncbi:MAG: Oar protein [uncultured Pyrinomonadaceae bacterium]|uniref:Oar protein n=1 Tax=uncultured Pyrinomonadaceae bacterium TaxID=2283094 RepID=A0A6J4NDZ7_9BACT|nr:MAG: Oar protein [uncultured Pyrinomonadaceae bacterium]